VRRGLWRGARPAARRVATAALAIGGVVAFAIFMGTAVGGTGDADRYGRVPLPGETRLDLPEGDVAVYYEERVTLHENDSLSVPDGLRVVARRENTRVRSERSTQNAVNLDGRSLREFAKLSIPVRGQYRVKARSDGPGSNSPAVTLGKGQLENLGRAGKRAAIAVGAGLVVGLAALLAARRADDPPPAAGASAQGASIRL
jgi:hypothetical protein